jgi:poly(A) polymerase
LSISTLPSPPRWLRRLAVLGGENEGLRLSKSEARDLASLRTARLDRDPRRAGLAPWRTSRHRRDPRPRRLLARRPSRQTEVRRGAQARFPVIAADLMPGLQGGPRRQLKALEARWLASDLTLSRRPAERGVTIRRNSATEDAPKKETSMEHGISATRLS